MQKVYDRSGENDVNIMPPSSHKVPKELISCLKLQDLVILQKIGVGGYSIVYLAEHSPSETQFALKRIPKEKLVKSKMFRQIRTEKKALEKLDHPLVLKM